MERKVFRSLVILAGVLIQTSFIAVIFPPHTYPNLILVTIIAWTITAGFEKIWLWVIGLGVFWDLISFSILGENVISFILVAYIVSFLSRRLILERRSSGFLIAILLVVVSTFFYNIFNIIFLEMFEVAGDFLWRVDLIGFFKNSIIQSILNIPLFGIVYILLSKANKYFSFYDNRVKIKNK